MWRCLFCCYAPADSLCGVGLIQIGIRRKKVENFSHIKDSIPGYKFLSRPLKSGMDPWREFIINSVWLHLYLFFIPWKNSLEGWHRTHFYQFYSQLLIIYKLWELFANQDLFCIYIKKQRVSFICSLQKVNFEKIPRMPQIKFVLYPARQYVSPLFFFSKFSLLWEEN